MRGQPAPAGPTVVIFRLGSLGDTVVALPCFHAIARRFPTHRRLVLTNAPVAAEAAPLMSVLDGSGLVHGAIVYPLRLSRPSQVWRLFKALKASRARTLVHLTPRGPIARRRDRLFFRLCGFRDIIGLGHDAAFAQARVDSATGDVEREAMRLARVLARELGPVDATEPAHWNLRLSDSERTQAATVLGPLAGRPFLAVNTGGKDRQKDWGEANWRALLRTLSARWPEHGLAFVGADSDRPRAEVLSSAWRGISLDLCGRATPRIAAAVVERSALFIGHDSGPLHLAAAVRAPAIGLFGPLNQPARWYPTGPRVRILHNLDGLDKIAVADVVAAADEMMSDGVDPPSPEPKTP